MRETIGSVSILSEGEQVSFVITNIGSYIVGCIPDAREDDSSWQNNILAKVNSIDDAQEWYDRHYGLK